MFGCNVEYKSIIPSTDGSGLYDLAIKCSAEKIDVKHRSAIIVSPIGKLIFNVENKKYFLNRIEFKDDYIILNTPKKIELAQIFDNIISDNIKTSDIVMVFDDGTKLAKSDIETEAGEYNKAVKEYDGACKRLQMFM